MNRASRLRLLSFRNDTLFNKNYNKKLLVKYLSTTTSRNSLYQLFNTNHLVGKAGRSLQLLNLNNISSNLNKNQLHTTNSNQFYLSNKLLSKDYYKILGVPKNADIKDIKKSYYQLAKKYHPDKQQSGDKAKFQEVSEAYEVLGDENKRKQYDTFGSAGVNGNSGGSPNSGGFGNSGGGFHYESQVDPEELFRTIFGDAFRSGGGSRSGAGNSQDFESMFGGFGREEQNQREIFQKLIDLTFEEACRGVNKELSLTLMDICKSCKGTRCAPNTKPTKCKQCNGTGMESIQTGPFFMRSTCRVCYGSRETIAKKCTECKGVGKTRQTRKVNVPVPAGVEDGQTMRLNVSSQEVYVTFKVQPSKIFRRDREDVHSDCFISISQAILGGNINIQGIYENHQLKIPKGTPSHERFILSNKGIKRVHSSGYGDHYVHIKIKVPK
jgi:DnaJ homolog subfamily A member 3